MRVSRGKSCLFHLPCKNYRRTSQKPPPSNGRSFANFTDFFSLNRLDTDSQELSQQPVFVFLTQSSIQLSNTSVTAVPPRPGTPPDCARCHAWTTPQRQTPRLKNQTGLLGILGEPSSHSAFPENPRTKTGFITPNPVLMVMPGIKILL